MKLQTRWQRHNIHLQWISCGSADSATLRPTLLLLGRDALRNRRKLTDNSELKPFTL